MELILAWTRNRTFVEAASLSLLVNVVVFLLALFVGEAILRLWRKQKVADPPLPLSRSEVALAAACVVLNSVVMLAGWLLFVRGIVNVDADPSPLRWLVDLVILTIVMDLAMYVTHRAAHHPIAFKYVHGIHHVYDKPRPLTLFVLHPIEVLGFGGLWIAVLCTHAFSLGGMLLYLTLNTTFGVVGHIGVEPLPRTWGKLVRLVGTSTFHARHHQDPTSNYGFYTTVWDRLFKTLGKTYDEKFGTR